MYGKQDDDDPLIAHFERKEPNNPQQQVTYCIKVKNKPEYRLKVDAINLNLYATGVGILSFSC
ncbi:MAG: hypothetical protein LUD02_02750 [Tannerellaceae bacterium]|nr:hypothetical protein [Tannerellaceae bacterium]MCD8263192.1 hypothetical protein [Tannerellaceae bacterium]